jgi:hypothetical protein
VATVSGSTVTAVGAGTATITARSTVNNSIVGSCTVTVQASFNGAGIHIVFDGLEDETITLDVTVDGSDQFVITVPAGFDRYLWYMDLIFMGEGPLSTVTYPVFFVTPGRHYITVIVEEDGYHFSKTLIYTVGY